MKLRHKCKMQIWDKIQSKVFYYIDDLIEINISCKDFNKVLNKMDLTEIIENLMDEIKEY